jgi:hypothetical protein
VTEAVHVCDSVPSCQAFGIGRSSDDSSSFNIELYSCLTSIGPGKSWATYRKQDRYSAPFEQRRGDQSACTSFVSPQTSFVCEQVPYGEGKNVTLTQCDTSIPAQKWKLEDISVNNENAGLTHQPGLAIASSKRGTAASGRGLSGSTRASTANASVAIDPALCKIPGMWEYGDVFEIRGSTFGAQVTSYLLRTATFPTHLLPARPLPYYHLLAHSLTTISPTHTHFCVFPPSLTITIYLTCPSFARTV